MWIYVLRRTLLLIPIFFAISVVVFSLIHLVPGDPIDSLLGPGSATGDRAALLKLYGLDKPLPVQYLTWLKKFLTGDMGQSIIEKQPVADMIFYNMPFTLQLGLFSLAISFFWAYCWASSRQRQGIRSLIMLQWSSRYLVSRCPRSGWALS